MYKNLFKKILIFALLFFASKFVTAQPVHEPAANNPEWTQPYSPFRIAGNLYYVGTYDLACYLVTTDSGHILINTGVASSTSQIKENIEALGFHFSDIKILLTTQVHYDHVGAMAAIKSETGACMMVDAADAAVMADGGNSDYAFGGKGALFAPVKADRLLRDGDTVHLGKMNIIFLHHPGHTKGACSFLFTVKDRQKNYRVLIANLPSIVVDEPFDKVTNYPNIAGDYAYTFRAMKNLTFDLWLSSHASQFDLHEKHKPGDKYNPNVFRDGSGYREALNKLQMAYEKKLKDDKKLREQ